MLQIVAIAWYLWPVPDSDDRVGPWLMGAAVIVTVVTGVDYVLQAVRLRRCARSCRSIGLRLRWGYPRPARPRLESA